MNDHNFTFPPYSYPQPTMEESVFQSLPYDGDFSPVIASYIDPNILFSSTDPYLSQWEGQPLQVKRWISDNQRTPLFNPGPYSNVVTSVARPAIAACPVLPRSHIRFPSPSSSSDRGLTAASPLAETDSFYDNNLPSTPSDTAVVSPAYHPGHLEYYTSQTDAIQFVNMGPTAPTACVRPKDVDPSQQLGYHDPETSQPEFIFGNHRSLSFESSSSHNDLDATQSQITVALTQRRMASPQEMRHLKLERRASSVYPALSDKEDSGVREARPLSKRTTDDDYEYTPGKKSRLSGTSSSRRTRAKPAAPKPLAGRSNPTTSNVASRPITSSFKKAKGLSCPECAHADFKDRPTLDIHIKKQHTRPFKCVFQFAGCTSTFATKNEWKRHTSTQHLVLHYWLCTEGQCGKTVDGSSPASRSSRSKPALALQGSQSQPYAAPTTLYSNSFHPPPPGTASVRPPAGVRFNRKDLYTQHVRRMHMPPQVKKEIKLLKEQKTSRPSSSSKGRKGQPESPLERSKLAWEQKLQQRQEAAVRDRIVLPKYMRCPATGCDAEFRGEDAWDMRMEHVAKHLERGDKGEVMFGGPEDVTLLEWASSPEVGVVVWEAEGTGRWVLNKIMGRGGSGATSKQREGDLGENVVDEGIEDAECEDDDVPL